jgi:hypothetical protein
MSHTFPSFVLFCQTLVVFVLNVNRGAAECIDLDQLIVGTEVLPTRVDNRMTSTRFATDGHFYLQWTANGVAPG